jgi:radical SAM superfamily enzyme YgiQ (UPF0313 family)
LRNIDTTDKTDFYYYYASIKTTLNEIHKIWNNGKIIIGGAGFSTFPIQILKQNDLIDFGVYLEGEDTILELLNNLGTPKKVKGIYYRENGKILYTGNRENFTNFDFIPDRSFFNLNQYDYPRSIGIQSKRGCVLQCSYCNYPSLNGTKLRMRKPNNIVDEIEKIIKTTNTKEIIFTDNVFNIPISHSIAICKEIINRNLTVRWSAWFDIKNIDQEFIDLAVKSGCYRMCFSPDGLVNETLSSLNKNITKNDITKLLVLTKRNKMIDFRFSVFALPPYQTIAGLIQTIIFVFKTHVLYRNSKCLVSWIRILPNTRLYKSSSNEEAISIDNLLPEKVVNKELLFYNKTTINNFIMLMYYVLLRTVLRIRSIRKIIKPNIKN